MCVSMDMGPPIGSGTRTRAKKRTLRSPVALFPPRTKSYLSQRRQQQQQQPPRSALGARRSALTGAARDSRQSTVCCSDRVSEHLSLRAHRCICSSRRLLQRLTCARLSSLLRFVLASVLALAIPRPSDRAADSCVPYAYLSRRPVALVGRTSGAQVSERRAAGASTKREQTTALFVSGALILLCCCCRRRFERQQVRCRCHLALTGDTWQRSARFGSERSGAERIRIAWTAVPRELCAASALPIGRSRPRAWSQASSSRRLNDALRYAIVRGAAGRAQ